MWLAYSSHTNRDGLAWPSDRTVAKETGLSFRTVRSAKTRFAKVGVLIPSEQKRKCGRFWVKPYVVVEPCAAMFQVTDARKDDTGEGHADMQTSPPTDAHFPHAADDQFPPPYQERYPRKKKENMPNGNRKTKDEMFLEWWEQHYNEKYGYRPSIPYRQAETLLKRHFSRGESLEQLIAAAEAYFADTDKFFDGHLVTMFLGKVYDRFKARAGKN